MEHQNCTAFLLLAKLCPRIRSSVMKPSFVATNLVILVLLSSGCGRKSDQPPSSSAANPDAAQPTAPVQEAAPQPPSPPPPIVVPAGTVFTVSLRQALGSKTSHQGDRFEAALATPIVVGGEVAVPKNSKANGTVTEAHAAGKFKGGATLALALEKVVVHGTSYTVHCSGVEEETKGKGKRTAGMVGGGAAGGALIGGLAGGGKGAAIGAAVGAGAGTAGAAFTGNNRDVSLPVETQVKFKLTESITVKQEPPAGPK